MLNKKFVKALIAILVFSMIIFPLISAVVSADECNILVFNFIDDEDDSPEAKIFYNKDITVAGSAFENTNITINKYWYRPAKEKSIVSKGGILDKDYSEGEWIFQKEFYHTVGASCIFAIPVRINMGKYKIEVIADYNEEITSKEVEIEYNDKDEIKEEIRQKIFRDLEFRL